MTHTLLNVDAKEHERGEKSRFLIQAGYDVIEAATEADAMRLVLDRRPAVVIINTRLPHVDGYRLGRQIKAHPDAAGSFVLLLAPAFEGTTPKLDDIADLFLPAPPYYPALAAQIRLLTRLADVTRERDETTRALLLERGSADQALRLITEQADRLKASEERLRVALAATRLGTWEWSDATKLVQADARTAELYDLPAGEPFSWQWLLDHRIHPDDRAESIARVRAAAHGDGWYRSTHRVVLGNGEVLWVQASGQMSFDGPTPTRRVVRLVGSTEDVTAIKQTERALRQSEARFRELIEALPLLAWTCEPDGACDYLSPQWVAYTGIAAERQLGTGWLEQVHPDDRERVQTEWQAAVAAKAALGIEFRIRRADGQFHWFDTRAVPIVDSDGRPLKWLGMNLDIDARKLAEEALRDADRRKDEFLAVLAHELRNPLAPIRNSVALLRRQDHTDPVAARAHEMIDRQVTHLARLVDDLLDVSRITQGKVRLVTAPMSLVTAIEQAIETTRPLLETRRIGLVVSLGPEPLPVVGDLLRLVQCIANLLDNAAKFTPEGRTISVATAVEDGMAVVRVQDPGIGISALLLPHIFDLFTQGDAELDRSQGGLGIGLTIVKAIVELHGGRVTATSAGTDLGSEFVIHLPLAARAHAEPNGHRQAGTGGGNPGGVRILLVDDNDDGAESLALLLELQGYAVRTAGNGPDAITAAVEFEPAVTVLDIGLPGMDGYEVAARLRADPRTARTALIALTGYGRAQDRDRALAVGFDHHLVKPVDPEALHAIIAGYQAAAVT